MHAAARTSLGSVKYLRICHDPPDGDRRVVSVARKGYLRHVKDRTTP